MDRQIVDTRDEMKRISVAATGFLQVPSLAPTVFTKSLLVAAALHDHLLATASVCGRINCQLCPFHRACPRATSSKSAPQRVTYGLFLRTYICIISCALIQYLAAETKTEV